MVDHGRFEVRFPNTTTKAKFYVQNAFCYTFDWTLQISRLLRFRLAVDAKTQLMRVAERTLNEVEHLLTPEGALSGWCSGWQNKEEELVEALREVEKAQIDAGIFLHLGTCFTEKESVGIVHRNQIRHYHKDDTFRVQQIKLSV